MNIHTIGAPDIERNSQGGGMNCKDIWITIFPDFNKGFICLKLAIAQVIFIVIPFMVSIFTGYTYRCILYYIGACNPAELSSHFALYRLVFPIFYHDSPTHLIFNLLNLFFLGFSLEKIEGGRKFLFLFLYSGISGYLWISGFGKRDLITIGSSTSIFGIYGALIADCVIVHKYSFLFNARYFIFFLGFSVFMNMIQSIEDYNISQLLGHLGGMIGGFLFIIASMEVNSQEMNIAEKNNKYKKYAKVAFVIIPPLLLFLTIFRFLDPFNPCTQ